MDFKKLLLDYYHMSIEEYETLAKPISEVKLLDPFSITVMPKIVSRIQDAIRRKEKIIIYGDFDCDGICATSIMVKTFQMLNYPVSYYIPSRYKDGYGLNSTNVEKMAKQDFKLIITVDNGISAFEAIETANSLGIDVIVVDHHDLPTEDVAAYAILHPIHSKVSDIVASGGYMSLFLSAALLNKYDDYLVTLAGLSVISDLMEMKGYNRDVVRLALYFINRRFYEPITLLNDNNDIYTEKTFGLAIAPKINSIGRLVEDTKVNKIVKYLTTESKEERLALREWILSIDEARKEKTKEATENLHVSEIKDEAICLKTDMSEGLIGLIANKIISQENKPVAVFTREMNDEFVLKGSIRSKEGFSIPDILKLNKDIIIDGGGHSFAGGISILEKDYDLFKKRFVQFAKHHLFKEPKEENLEISITDITMENYKILRSFGPFGMGFKEPEFILRNVPTRTLSFISGGKHLSTKLSMNSKILGWNIGEEETKKMDYINIIGSFLLTSFRNEFTVEFRVKKIEENLNK